MDSFQLWLIFVALAAIVAPLGRILTKLTEIAQILRLNRQIRDEHPERRL